MHSRPCYANYAPCPHPNTSSMFAWSRWIHDLTPGMTSMFECTLLAQHARTPDQEALQIVSRALLLALATPSPGSSLCAKKRPGIRCGKARFKGPIYERNTLTADSKSTSPHFCTGSTLCLQPRGSGCALLLQVSTKSRPSAQKLDDAWFASFLRAERESSPSCRHRGYKLNTQPRATFWALLFAFASFC